MSKGTADRLRVVSGRDPARQLGPLDKAKELAAGAPSDFLAADYSTWSWTFRLAQRLRGIEGITADTDPWLLREPVLIFCQYAVALLDTEGIQEMYFDAPECIEDRFAEFCENWPRVRLAEGEGPLELAFAQAKARPIIPDRCPSTTYALIVSTAYHLQKTAGEGRPIVLPVTRLSRLVQKTPQHVGALLRLASRPDRDLLRLTDESYSYTEGRARRFLFNLEAKGFKLAEPRRPPARVPLSPE